MPSSKGAWDRLRAGEYGGGITLASGVHLHHLTTLYTGSPWVPGQHKVAVGCLNRAVGDEFEYGAVYDTKAEGDKIHGNQSGNYEVELVCDLQRSYKEWRVKVVRELP